MLRFPSRLGATILVAAIHLAQSLAAYAQGPGAAPDCARAKSAAERAICTTPELAAADAAMAKAYSELRADLPLDQKSALLDDQRRWIGTRDALCSDQKEGQLIKCLLKETGQRRQLLAGEGPNGAVGAPRLEPAFFHEARNGRYEINVVYPRIAKPGSAAEKAFNNRVHTLVLGKAPLGEVRESENVPGSPMVSSYDATYDVTYLGRNLAAVVFSISTYGAGAAHPVSGRESLVFDFAHGRQLQLADIVESPKQAVAAISQRCKEQLEAQAAKDDWQLFDNADFAATVGEMRYWAPDETGVDILFDPYSVAAYAFGQHQCRLSWADLSPSLKANGPLPPR